MEAAKKILLRFLVIGWLCPLTASAGITSASFESGLSGFSNTSTYTLTRKSGNTPSGNTGPNGGADGTNYYVYFETSNGSAYNSGNTAYFQTNSITHNTMSFYYHMYGADTGLLGVDVYYDGQWIRVWDVEGEKHAASSSSWTEQVISLAFYPGSKHVRFVTVAKGGYRGDIAIDEVKFYDSGSVEIEYQYDALGRLTCAIDNANGARNIEYDAAGNRKNVSVGSCN